MSRQTRAISTVVDVSFALLLLVAAIAIVGTLEVGTGSDHRPRDADRTAEVIAGSTMNTTYSTEGTLRAATAKADEYDLDTVDVDDLGEFETERITHTTIAGHLSNLALATVEIDDRSLTPGGTDYATVVDQKFQSRLLEAEYWANVTAVWQPFDASDESVVGIAGTSRVGPAPPPGVDVSATTVTVPSGMSSVRSAARDAATGDDNYAAVADVVARSIVETLLPRLESQRAIENSASDRLFTVYRYLRLAELLSEDESADSILDLEHLERRNADAGAANGALTDALSERIAAAMASSYETDRAAVENLSPDTVTLVVRTWNP